MFKEIYSRVFNTASRAFDKNEHNLVVLLNFANDTEIGAGLVKKLEDYFDASRFVNIPISCNDIKQELFLELRRQSDTRRSEMNCTTHYIMVFDHISGNSPEAVFSTIKGMKDLQILSGGDTLSLFTAVLSAYESDKTVPFIQLLERGGVEASVYNADISEDDDEVADNVGNRVYNNLIDNPMKNLMLHVFVKNIVYGCDGIIEDMVGAVIQYAQKASFRNFQEAIKNEMYRVNTYVPTFPPASVEHFKATPELIWIASHSKFCNDTEPFLKSYLRGLFNERNIAKLDDFELDGICDDIYKASDIDYSRLYVAIKHIPQIRERVICANSLRDYFVQLYGDSALDIVGLTIKLNIQNRNVYDRAMLSAAAKRLFDAVSGYHSESMVNAVCKKIDSYIVGIDGAVTACNKDIEVALNKTGGVTVDDIRGYITKFVKACDEEARKAFWVDVKNYVLSNKNEFDKYERMAKDLTDKLAEMRNDLQGAENSVQTEHPVRTAQGLLEFVNSDSISHPIHEAYDVYRAEHTTDGYTYNNSFDPMISNYTFMVTNTNDSIDVNDVYTVHISRRIGVYYEFIYNGGKQ